MSKYQVFVGIDVSKDHLDLAICTNGKVAPATRIANTISAIEEYLSTFSEKNTLSSTLFCLEDTGIFSLGRSSRPSDIYEKGILPPSSV